MNCMKKIKLLLLACVLIFAPALALASTSEGTINPSYRYAWSDKIGQIDMALVKVFDGQLKGVAVTANLGTINFDDASFHVTNDGAGNLSGNAYGTQTGLINFTGVKIGYDGNFSGMADGSFMTGKIYFDCTNNTACPSPASAKVMTDWRPVANRQAVVTPVVAPVVAVVTTPAPVTASKDYSSCDSLNDYLSYSRCVSEIDNRRSQTTTLVTEEPKAVDGDYIIKINDGHPKAGKTKVSVKITAPKEAIDMSVAKDNNFGFIAKQKVASTIDWQIEDEEGTPQYVYVKFYDQSGAPLKVVASSIILDKRQGDVVAEKEALTAFKLMYGRISGSTAVDTEALKIMAYGLGANTARDLTKEASALKRFRQVYKRAPASSQEWNYLKGYAYAETVVKNSTSTTVVTTPVTEEVVANVVTEPVSDCRLKTKLTGTFDVGSKGKEVTALQESLKCQGLLVSDYKVTGTFDSDTELAVGAFQKQNKLLCKNGTYCGAVGPATRTKLNNLPAPKKVEVKTATTESNGTVKAVLTKNLTLGANGDEVKKLQEFLAKDKTLYPGGKVNGNFGPATEAAVKKFQVKHGLKCSDGTACGYVGPATMKKLNEAMGE